MTQDITIRCPPFPYPVHPALQLRRNALPVELLLPLLPGTACLKRFPDPASIRPVQLLRDPRTDLRDLVQVSQSGESASLEGVEDVLGGDVAGGPGGVGAAAEPAHGGVEGADAEGERRKDVGHAHAERVVVMALFVHAVR